MIDPGAAGRPGRVIERLVPAGAGRAARIRFSDRSLGDFDIDGDPAELEARRRGFMGGRWTWMRQVHGARVVAVSRPGQGAGSVADGAATARPGAVLAVQTADCAPVVVVGSGAVGIAHAGWRGILAGVIGAVVEAVGACGHPGGGRCRAVIGPVIRPSHYEFGPSELDAMAAAVGQEARAVTARGAPALDLAAAVEAALRDCGVDEVEDLGLDTSDERFFSHRVRGDRGRQAAAVRLESAHGPDSSAPAPSTAAW